MEQSVVYSTQLTTLMLHSNVVEGEAELKQVSACMYYVMVKSCLDFNE